MYKDTVIKILTSGQLNQQEALEFVTDYVKSEKGIDLDHNQLNGILQAIQMGMFNLRYAAEQAASKLGIQITNVLSKEGHIIKTICQEPQLADS